MTDESCMLEDLLCGITATAYVDKYGLPYPTDEPGDIWIDRRMSHPYWCTNCSAEFSTREEALEHINVEKVAA